jgi:hypothetical protein
MGRNQSRTLDYRMDYCGSYTCFQRPSQSHSKCSSSKEQKIFDSAILTCVLPPDGTFRELVYL